MDNIEKKLFVNRLREHGINWLYYFSLIENAKSIILWPLDFRKRWAKITWILPKKILEKCSVEAETFANEEVQERRDRKDIVLTDNTKKNIHELVPLYLTSKTPTLYKKRDFKNKGFFVKVKLDILLERLINFCFTDGNAWSAKTRFFNSENEIENIPFDILHAQYRNDFDDGKRQRNAEILIFPYVSTKFFEKIIVYNDEIKGQIEKIVEKSWKKIHVEVGRSYFF